MKILIEDGKINKTSSIIIKVEHLINQIKGTYENNIFTAIKYYLEVVNESADLNSINEFLKYSPNVVITKDIEIDENSKILKENFNSFDFKNNIYSNIPLNIEMFTDYESYMINSASIYYKLNNQNIYMKDNLNKISDNYYGYVIPGDFIDGKYINYNFY